MARLLRPGFYPWSRRPWRSPDGLTTKNRPPVGLWRPASQNVLVSAGNGPRARCRPPLTPFWSYMAVGRPLTGNPGGFDALYLYRKLRN